MTDALHGLTRGCPSLQLAHAKISHHAGSHLTVWTFSKPENHFSTLIKSMRSSCSGKPSPRKQLPVGLNSSRPVL